MPSDRSAGSELGCDALAASSRVMLSALLCIDAAHPPAPRAASRVRLIVVYRERCIAWLLLAIGVQHVFEPHPLRVEIQVDISGGAVAVLADEQLRGTLDIASRFVHVLPEQTEDDVCVLLHGSENAEVIEHGTSVR